MHHHAGKRNVCLRCRKALIIELAERFAVYRIAVCRTKLFEVEQSCAMANLLVRNKGNFERWVLELRVVGQTLE